MDEMSSIVATVVGSAIGIGVESVWTVYNIRGKRKELEEFKLNDMAFTKYVARRVSRGVLSVTGGVAGGLMGQMCIVSMPFYLSALVGSLLGGLLGTVLGQCEGILIGELVEAISTRGDLKFK